MISLDEIRTSVAAYLQRHPDEAGRLVLLTAALDGPGDPTSRNTHSGHITCSAVVIDLAGRVLHIHHNALDRWLRPGGHVESGDTSLLDVATHEVAEETGIDVATLTLLDQMPIDIDVHPIRANAAKGEPAHQHFDFRYAFIITATPDISLQTDEVDDFAWLPAAEIQPARLAARIATATSVA